MSGHAITQAVREIADAVLYEGYMLYPYRPSSVKNRQRWTFGGLYPEPYARRYGDASGLTTEMLVESDIRPAIDVRVRFLHLMQREDGIQEATPREVGVGGFEFAAGEQSGDGHRRYCERLSGEVSVDIDPIEQALWRVRVRAVNHTAMPESAALTRDAASMYALVSTHAILYVRGGAFVSMTDPPGPYRTAAAQCSNIGVWPVLAGAEGSRDCILASPIILYDYPRIAPESAGDLFDGTEIDEILSLRILTLTEAEKDEMRQADPRTRHMLDRTEALSPEQMMKLHGVLRNPHAMEGKP